MSASAVSSSAQQGRNSEIAALLKKNGIYSTQVFQKSAVDGFLASIREAESNNNYHAVSTKPGSTASGAYKFTNGNETCTGTILTIFQTRGSSFEGLRWRRVLRKRVKKNKMQLQREQLKTTSRISTIGWIQRGRGGKDTSVLKLTIRREKNTRSKLFEIFRSESPKTC